MINMLLKLGQRTQRYYVHLGRSRAREVLLRYNDRILIDAGFSRQLLEEGVEAWPWRLESQDNPEPLELQRKSSVFADTVSAKTTPSQAAHTTDGLNAGLPTAANTLSVNTEAQKQAIKELSAYSDKELHDVGISRGSIEEAVLNGRPGVDIPVSGGTRDAA